VAALLGREPQGDFEVVVRDGAGGPVVIRNAPLLRDGTPMPTRYWLVGDRARRAVDRLEAAGGVRRAERAVDPEALARAHAAYAAERDAALPAGWAGPRPSGGVGGTRRGVKCLHAHYAWHLAGGPDPVGRWVAAQLAGPAAAVDCGTNSTRLLVARPGQPALERLMRITRLGQGVDRTGRLAAEAIDRTVAVLAEFREVMDRLGVGPVRMTATSAARDAGNRDEFFERAEAAIGVRPELLSGEEEARLSFAGATAELARAGEVGPWLVVDVGGGSTELAVGPGPGGPAAVASLDVGCVRLSERFLRSDPPNPAELAAAAAEVRRQLDAALERSPALAAGGRLVGLAGTFAALAAIDLGLSGYDRALQHHYRLGRPAVESALDRLAATDGAGRRRIPGVEEGRADVIVGGTVVVAEVMRRLGYDECLTSEADILDGLVDSIALPTV
jgi:exopolyphosphatase/guanosine-5'-triphosphate,3'-diphosphate pyrophosphatase